LEALNNIWVSGKFPDSWQTYTVGDRTKCHQQWNLFLFSSKFRQNFIQNTKHQHTFYRNKSRTA